jgi:hypothetical protein
LYRSAERPARESLPWPTGWACIGGGFFLIWPFARGVLAGVGVEAAAAPVIRQPVLLSLAIGLGLLLLSLPGWWAIGSGSLMVRGGVVLLAIAFGMWLVDVADSLGVGLLSLQDVASLYATAVGLGSILLAVGLVRRTRLPRDGLLLVGVGGALGMALLAAPWPLGLGPIVPATVVIYAIGWIRLGMALRTRSQVAMQPRPGVE